MSQDAYDPRESRKAREFEQHHREILGTAVTLFADKGYHQTTVQMIAERAGFSVGYLYKHFSGKEEMYQEVVNYHMERLDAILDEVRGKGATPLGELRAALEAICGHFNHHPDFMRIYHDEVGAEACDAFKPKERHHQDLVDLLTRARAAGELKEVDVDLVAAIFDGASLALFRELANRGGEAPFDPLPGILFSLILDPLRNARPAQ